EQKAQSKDWAFCFICCLSESDSLSRTNPPGADLNVAKQRPEGWRAGKPAINGQASNTRRNLMRKHGGFFVFLLFAGKRSPGQDKIVGNNVAQHGVLPGIQRPGIKSVRSPSSRTGFLRFCPDTKRSDC
ncbi:hypothetical protein ACLZTU_13530, partial [Raoultella ornithinolytica]|uniref:hypothetical protein n=1 Tax=Raoultella ornithinolytica TaxID=54291 RepID=UPI0039B3CB2C